MCLGRPVFIWMSIEGLFNGIQKTGILDGIGYLQPSVLMVEPRSYLPHFIAFIIAMAGYFSL